MVFIYKRNNYNEIFTFNNLYMAHKKEVIEFELDLGNNLWKLKN